MDYYDLALTGYRASDDVGLQLSIYAGAPPTVAPGRYSISDYPSKHDESNISPLEGEAWFREWMSGCTPYPLLINDWIQLEPEDLLDALAEEVDNLIAEDPAASWDEDSRTVVGSEFETSPRILAFSFYNPSSPATAVYGSHSRWVVLTEKIVFFFVESRGPGTTITGRIVDVMSWGTTPVEPATWGRLKTLYGTKGSP